MTEHHFAAAPGRRGTRKATAKIRAAAALAALSLVAACSGGSSGGGSAKGAIEVGSINALSGSATFPEASRAAKVVFDEVNAQGGINGRKINYTALDDKGDAATASADARQLVQSQKVVALVGSASLLECQVNGAYYVQQKVLSVQGTGVDQACFNNPNISPVNLGPFKDAELTLIYGTRTLGLKKICGFLLVAGGTEPTYKQAFDGWTKATGASFAHFDNTVPYGVPDWTPYVVKAKNAGCDGLFANTPEGDAVGMIKAVQGQGWHPTFLLLTSTYSAQFGKAIGPTGARVHVPAEFAPYDDPNSSATKAWRELMIAHNVPLTSFGQGGYLAATFFVDVLKGIKGAITRDSVSAALRAAQPMSHPMIGTPWVFGDAKTHSSINAGWPVTLTTAGTWKLAADNWVTLPS